MDGAYVGAHIQRHSSRLEENRLRPDKGEVVELWQALVADTGESIPDEWRKPILCSWPIYHLRLEIPGHEEICYLGKEKQGNL